MGYQTSVRISVPLEVWLHSRRIWEHHFAKLTFYGNEVCVRLLVMRLHREEASKLHVAKPALNFCVVKTNVKMHNSKVPICGPADYTQQQSLYSPFCCLDDVVNVLLYCRHEREVPKKIVEAGEQYWRGFCGSGSISLLYPVA